MNTGRKTGKIDATVLGCYIFLVVFGWMNIYSSSSQDTAIFDTSAKYAMQLIWIASALVIDFILIKAIPKNFFNVFAWWIYALEIVLLLVTIFAGKEVNGSKSWLVLGPVRIQPAEFSKIAVALALSSIMEKFTFNFSNWRDAAKVLLVLAAPAVLILLEKETGLMLVYLAFFLVFYREGMSGWVLIAGIMAVALFILTLLFSPYTAFIIWTALIMLYESFDVRRGWIVLLCALALTALLIMAPRLAGIEVLAPVLTRYPPEIWAAIITLPAAAAISIYSLFTQKWKQMRNVALIFAIGMGLILSCGFAFNSLLKEHQRLRIEQLLGIVDDPMGAGYNVHQSMIAIGSGGVFGKGFTQGTQTKFDFVPEQSTDFIFCTVGEEWGFVGSLAVIICYGLMITRMLYLAERQKDRFNRIFGYCTASCILVHVVINIGMTIGMMPVIGIPLPMLSYGGSSLWAFSILIFTFLRLDSESKW